MTEPQQVEKSESTGENDLQIEKIIGEIRTRILENNKRNGGKMTTLDVSSDYFSDSFYENLYQSSISRQEIHLQVTETRIPIIGPIIDRLRTMVHQVILFYLSQVLSEQTRINQLNNQLINELGMEIEKIGRQVAQQQKVTPAE